ncbi:MAG: ribonuclease R [Gammaproteobacteria bacterium]|nr:MAG: ribonuclease R [Gammaproteobacteria bacterium]
MAKSRTPTRRPKDPQAQREASRYEHPVPSRELVLKVLGDSAAPLDFAGLCEALGVRGPRDEEAMARRLGAMVRDGQLLCNRRGVYAPADRLSLVRGRVQGHREGFGFFIPESGGDDWYISAYAMRSLLDGDEILARLRGHDRRGRPEAEPVEILVRHTQSLVGRYYEENRIAFVKPENPRIPQDVLITPGATAGARHGQYVVVHITRYPEAHVGLMGEVREVIGDEMAPGMEIEVAIRNFGIPHEWPPAVLAEAARVPAAPEEQHKQHRVDLRELPLLTIDGEDARDFDDAVHAAPRPGGGWMLWVAIADVSHYVQVGSALDAEASVRGNSVYFPGRVVPMLPEALSNGLCSLNSDVDRLCMVCEMAISPSGQLLDYRFMEGVMRSHARLTYTEVARMLETGKPAASGERAARQQALLPHLKELERLYKALLKARQKRGAVDFDTPESRIVFNEERKIADIIPVIRNDAHRLIEECMLCANVATANFLEAHGLQGLYRVHHGPSMQRLENLRSFLGELGLDLGGGDTPTPKHYQALLQQVLDRPDAHLIQTMLLRSMSQARYQVENEGHFGLHYAAYTHFTSPIRRYPDLLVHRAIRSVIRSRKPSEHVERVSGAGVLAKSVIYPYDGQVLAGLAEQCSMTERRADEATRDVVSWLKCEFLSDRVGEQFEGVVSAVTSFGLFVELADLYTEGLVHVSSLANDYYQFDAAGQRLIGEHSRQVFRLGDRVTVKVMAVNLDERKIDLGLESLQPGVRRQARGAVKPASRKAGKGQRDGKKPARNGSGARHPKSRRRR